MTIAQVDALLLAGGRGSRMGGVDKGLQPLDGRPLAAHALERLRRQQGERLQGILVNANRNLETYRALGLPVCPDALAGFPGPLAGFLAGLEHGQSPWLLTVPCDTPRFPLDLLERLAQAAERAGADLALPLGRDDGRLRRQPVFCLMRRELRDGLRDYLQGGGRKIDDWIASVRHVAVTFDAPGDDPLAFCNANTLAELQALETGFRNQSLTPTKMKTIEQIAAELQGYDPGALRADAVSEFLARLVEPLQDTETVGVFEALGRVLATDLISPLSVPPHDNSAMDGFAFDGSQLQPDQALTLRLVGTAYAGAAWQGSVATGECVRIMTGAVMPAGLDTVVPVEFARIGGETVTLPAGCVLRGDNRRRLGEDLLAGAPALRAGTRLGPAALGLIASLGLASVDVRRRPKVAFFSTGDEILSLGEAPRAGAVYDSNRYTLFGLLTRLGVETIDLGAVRDDPASLEAALRRAAEADVVITSGGVSVGEADHTQTVMKRLGEVAFWRIAMRPGRPMAVGRLQQDGKSALLFGLPGNPVAVMVTFLAFVRPALLRLMGATDREPLVVPALSQEPIRKKPGRTEFQRGIASRAADGSLRVRTTGSQGSGVLRSMAEANCLLVLPHEQGDVQVGDAVDLLLFDGLI